MDFVTNYWFPVSQWLAELNQPVFLFSVAGIQLLAVLALCRWRWRDYFIPRSLLAQKVETEEPAEEPLFLSRPLQASIVIPCYNTAEALEANLPAFLEQRFDDYEVIVVDEASTDDTSLILQRLEAQYSHLRHTFVPDTARYVSRIKLAVTLGVRAARAPWIVLTTPDACPRNELWLATLAQHFSDEADFVLGCATYAETAGAKRAVYERLRRQLMLYRAARSGAAIGADRANMALRRGWFLANKGYADSLTSPLGEDDLLIAAMSRSGRTALAVTSDAVVEEAFPGKAALRDARIYRREVMRHWSPRGRRFLFREGAASLSAYVLLLAALCYGLLRFAGYSASLTFPLWACSVDVFVLLLWLLGILLPYALLRRLSRRLALPRFNAFYLMWEGLVQPWRHAGQRFARWRRRHDFVRR